MAELYDLDAWRASLTASEVLPSGLPVRLRRNVQLVDIAAQGDVPAPLMAQVDDIISQAGDGITVKIEDFPRYAEVIGLVVKAVVVSPPIADEPDATHISMAELSFTDRLFVFNWAHQGAAQLATFPQQARARTPRGRNGLRQDASRSAAAAVGGLADQPDHAGAGDAG